MTQEEYGRELDRLYRRDRLDELYELQYQYMNNVLAEFKQKLDGSTEMQICYDLLWRAVNMSESGNAVVYLSDYGLSEEEEENVIDILEDGYVWETIGHYLLDDESHEEDDDYVIDVMFGGYYVPEWDGWRED